jgi:hypothetical protein
MQKQGGEPLTTVQTPLENIPYSALPEYAAYITATLGSLHALLSTCVANKELTLEEASKRFSAGQAAFSVCKGTNIFATTPTKLLSAAHKGNILKNIHDIRLLPKLCSKPQAWTRFESPALMINAESFLLPLPGTRISYMDTPVCFDLEVRILGNYWGIEGSVGIIPDFATNTCRVEMIQGSKQDARHPKADEVRLGFKHMCAQPLALAVKFASAQGFTKFAIRKPEANFHTEVLEKAKDTSAYQFFRDRYRSFLFCPPPSETDEYWEFDISAMQYVDVS